LVIHKYANPRCFSKNKEIFNNLSLIYRSNKKAWMTADIFTNWLISLNERFKQEKKNTLFILDNAPVHPYNLEFSNIRLEFLPKNCTSVLQPLDNGIINNFKIKYINFIRNKILFDENEDVDFNSALKKIDLLDVLIGIEASWNSISQNTIVNCWKNCLDYNNSENINEVFENDFEEENMHVWDDEEYDDEFFLENIINQGVEISENVTLEASEKPKESYKSVVFSDVVKSVNVIEGWCLENDKSSLSKLYTLKDSVLIGKKKLQTKYI
jgi:hypothetical protein